MKEPIDPRCLVPYREVLVMTKALPLLLLAFLTSCGKTTHTDTCQVVQSPRNFEGTDLRLRIEATFVGNDALVSHLNCQSTCAFWTLKSDPPQTELESSLRRAIAEKRRSHATGVSGDLMVVARIKARYGNSPRLFVSKVEEFQMRDVKNAPNVVCGQDYSKPLPKIGDCSVDAAGCK
jgi:hypothetical protein